MSSFKRHAEKTANRIAGKHGLTLSDLRKIPLSEGQKQLCASVPENRQLDRSQAALIEVRKHFKFLTNEAFSRTLRIRISPTKAARTIISKR